MSIKHPIVAVTGSSGSGTSSVKTAFEQIFEAEDIRAAMIEGDCFHRFDREEMQEIQRITNVGEKHLTHFGEECNLFEELEAVFAEYSSKGSGKRRYYIHNDEEAAIHGAEVGSLTEWEPLPENSDLLLYEGLHGGVMTDKVDVAQHVDLLIGVVPIINLEWIQKIQRDQSVRGYSAEDATKMILGRMHDYVHFITPQFSRTDINFQRVPTIDTSNPFAADHIPSNDESYSVIHIRNQEKIEVDFQYLLKMLDGSFMSNPTTIVVPAGKQIFAMKLILNPVIRNLMREKQTH